MLRVRLAAAAASALVLAACGDGGGGGSPQDPDAPPVVIDAPDGPLLDPVTIVMAVDAGVRRPLVWPAPVTAFTAELDDGDPALDLSVAGVVVNGAGLRVVRGHGRVATAAGVIPLTLVVAVDGAVFTGRVSDDALDAANWDAAAGAPIEEPWVFVEESLTHAHIPDGTVHAHDVLVDARATVVTDHLVVESARFIGHGTLVATGIGVTRTTIECRGGSVEDLVPLLQVNTACTVTRDITTERIVVDTGTLDIDGGALVDTGVGESFVRNGGTLRVRSGTLRNRRAMTFQDGSAVISSAGSLIDGRRIDIDGDATLTVGGGFTTETILEIKRGLVVTTATATMTNVETLISDELQNGGTAAFGRLVVAAGATLINQGTATADRCTVNGTIVGPSPCP